MNTSMPFRATAVFAVTTIIAMCLFFILSEEPDEKIRVVIDQSQLNVGDDLIDGQSNVITNNTPLREFCNSQGYLFQPLDYCLADHFAPQYRFHSEENHFPAPVAWYLDRVSLRFSQGESCTDEVIQGEFIAGVTVEDLPNRYREVRDQVAGFPLLGCKGTGRRMPSDRLPEGRHGFFLHNLDNANEHTVRAGLQPINGQPNEGWDINAHVARRYDMESDDLLGYEIQYWMFFPRDGGIAGSGHDGDWELTKYHVDLLGRMTAAFHKRHRDSPIEIPLCEITFVDDTGISRQADCSRAEAFSSEFPHPVVYVAESKHSPYATAGSHDKEGPVDDDTDDNGIPWLSKGKVVLLGERFSPKESLEWLDYAGRWGELGTDFIVDFSEIFGTNGPTGPAFKEWYCESGGENTKQEEFLDACQVRCPLNVTPPQSWVILYRDENFDGPRELHRSRPADDCMRFRDFHNINFNDYVSSIEYCLPEGSRYELWSNFNFTGRVMQLTGTGQRERIERIWEMADGLNDDTLSSSRFMFDDSGFGICFSN